MKPDTTRQTTFIVCALLMLLICIVYCRVVGFKFLVYDDPLYVVNNPRINGLTASNISWAMKGVVNSNWQPTVWLSYMLDSQIGGIDSGLFHLTNLIIHIANTLLLLYLLKRMTGSLWRSAFVAAMFALHPLHVESVAWISERKDVLSTLLWLLTMLAYIRYTEMPNLRRYILVFIVFALGLMAKPMLVTLPIILFLLDYWPLGRLGIAGQNKSTKGYRKATLKRLMLEKLPLIAPAIAVGIVTILTQKASGAMQELDKYPFGVRTANAAFSYVTYLRKMLWPNDLAAFYPHPKDSLPIWQVMACVMLIAALTWLFARARRYPYMLVGWLWYLISLAPVIGFIQVGMQAMADRYTYVPMIGIAIIAAWAVPDMVYKNTNPNKSKTAILASTALIAIAAFSVCTYYQIGYWRDDAAVFGHAIKIIPDNYTAHNDLGVALMYRGENQAALEQFREAVRIDPTCMRAQYNIINQLYVMGDVDGAIKQTHALLRSFPHEGRAYLRLGIIYLRQSRLDPAEKNIRQALRESPKDPKVHQAIGMLLLKKGKVDEAIARLNKAAKLSPQDPDIKQRLEYAKSLKRAAR
ncbi:tetratricopeptide repeat protein [bacterium]|nr:tetratricopeptide repeat protein [bacterium]